MSNPTDPNQLSVVNLPLGGINQNVKQVKIEGNRVTHPIENYQYHWLKYIIFSPHPKDIFDDLSRYFLFIFLSFSFILSAPIQAAIVPSGIIALTLAMMIKAADITKDRTAQFHAWLKTAFCAIGLAGALLVPTQSPVITEKTQPQQQHTPKIETARIIEN